MKTFHRDGKVWHWPEHDEKLIQVFGWVKDIDYIMQFVDKRDICIQAGGACGQWPVKFSEYFNKVYTFEPDIENFECLVKNAAPTENIVIHNCALDGTHRTVSMVLDDTEINNCGAYYPVTGGGIPTLKIDDLELQPDLIQLDIEGFEINALKGAEETINKYHPVIVIEEKPLPHIEDHLKARRYLESLGYQQVGAIHRDVVFK